ncbi:MAG: Anaerobic nitric oxide reductase transcription regulator NorR [Desulfovibrio sp.]
MQPQSKFRFATLSHSDALCDTIRKHLTHEDDFTVQYRLVPMGEELQAAESLLESGIEAILCIGGTANTLKHTLGADSLAIIERTDMDVVERLLHARQFSREVALSTDYRQAHNIPLMEQLLDMRIHHVLYTDPGDLERNAAEAMAKGIRTCLGGGLICRWVERAGGIGIVLEPSRACVLEALEHARSIARRKRHEEHRQLEFLAILRRLEDGVICVDHTGKVFFANPSARRMLSVHPNGNIRGENAHLEPLGVDMALRDGTAIAERLVTVGRTQFMAGVMPLPAHAGTRGAVVLFRDIASLQNMDRKIRSALYSRGFVSRHGVTDLMGESQAMARLRDKIRRYAGTDAAVHIHGETGTGKEIAAHALHMESARCSQPFVVVNCSALPEPLLESELFGHEEGAFTGARRGGKAGLFEMANRGTLFLDEIGEINHAVQLRLLRALEAREIMRLGGSRVVPVDARIISASHKPLAELVKTGQFRADLYFRLVVLQLSMPPLRRHTEDIPVLLAPLLARHGRTADALTPAMLAILRGHTWPGNVRELISILESYFVLLGEEKSDDALLREVMSERTGAGTLSPEIAAPMPMNFGGTLKDRLEAAKIHLAREALIANNNDRAATAKQLGVSYNTLWRILRDQS